MTVELTGASQPAAGINIPLPPGDPRWGELAFMNIGTPEDPAYLRWSPEGRYYRRWNTRHSPLAFMLVYLTGLLQPLQTPYGPIISFSEFHLAMYEEAKKWMEPVGRRTGIIAPRGGGKSVSLFKGLPLWALAHGHRKFFMGYADTTGQASEHGDDLRDQLTTNELLLFDYPELWTFRGGRNNQHMIETRPDMEGMYAAGFRKDEALEIYQSGGRVFAMAGLDKATLGKSRKIGRPDLFTVDDGEPSADGYARQGGIDRKMARLNTIRDVILRMTPHAAVLLSGTVTMPNSIADDLVRHALGEPTEKWVTEEEFNAAYFNAIQHEGTPYERSLWPEKWSLEWLKQFRDKNPEKYALHFANRPMTMGGHYWQQDDFEYGLHWPIAYYIMYVDPAEVAEEGRDKTAWVVIGLDRPPPADRAVVLFVHQGHFDDTELGHQIVQFKRCNPQIPILDLYVEGYNSGALRYKTLKAMMPPDIRFPPDHMDKPGPMLGPAGEKGKDARIQRALPPYRQRRVRHLHPFSDLEALLTAYPKVRHKDLPDALAGALRKGLRD